MSNSNVKKAFQEVVALLEANKNKKVSTIMDQILELVTAKSGGKTFYKDDQGNVIAIYCYYHKQWELVSEVEFGKKKSTATGLNTMCKQGVSNWSKQQREMSKAKDELFKKVANEEVEASTLTEALLELDVTRLAIKDDEQGFDTLDKALAFFGGEE